MRRFALVLALALLACVPTTQDRPWRAWGDEPSVVLINEDVLQPVRFFYEKINGRSEFGVCLRAEEVQMYEGPPALSAYEVREAVMRPIFGADSLGIREIRCRGQFSGRLHTHPKTCGRSAIDRLSFWSEGFRYELIACPDGIVWYTRNGASGFTPWPR